jgi:REP element-mobilizing transposase RayT
LNHTQWECKYHIVFIPKYRRKVLYGELRRRLAEVFRKLAEQRESRIEEGHLMADHVHMMISIPPKYSVAQVVGYIKGKSAIHVAPEFGERKRNNSVSGKPAPFRALTEPLVSGPNSAALSGSQNLIPQALPGDH